MLTSPSRHRLFPFALGAIAAVAAVAERSTAAEPADVATEIIQETAQEPTAVRYGSAIATRYKVGAKIAAKGGAVQNILVMVAVPLECGEQDVQVVEEDFSPHVESVEFRQLPIDKHAPPGARQMLITISELPARQEAHALITYEVVTKTILPPEETSTLKAPAKPDRTLKPYLSASPFINVNHRKIRDAVKEALSAPEKAEDEAAVADGAEPEASPGNEPVADASAYEEVDSAAARKDNSVSPATAEAPAKSAGGELIGVDSDATFQTGHADETTPTGAAAASASDEPNDWQRVERLYDYVIEHVKYEEGAQDKSSVQALQEGKGDCHGISALFVAMCRTAKIPARMVWVDGHQYAEFYLEDEAGKGHWYPVQSAGTRAFGEMPTPKVILQKGDNFRVPERRRERLRYASDFTLLLSSPKHKPKVSYVREQL